LFLLGRPLLENALEQIRQRVFSTDLLLVGGVIASFVYSVISVWSGRGEIYFEVGCMILVMVTLGRWLEATGKLKATQALDRLQQLLPETVARLTESGESETIPNDDVRVGDLLLVRADERIPADGRLRSPHATIDEQLLTGESWPVEKGIGEPVAGGTLNLSSQIQLEVTALPNEGTLSRLIAAVREARQKRGAYQLFADRVSRWFVPLVAGVALIVFVVHAVLSGWMPGVLAGLSVVLIACPCALGLATPMAVWAAIGEAARHGIVFRNGDALERMSEIRAVRFDKTGTLTRGEPRVGQLECDPETRCGEVRRRALALARASNHVFSQAIVKFVGDDCSDIAGGAVSSVPGRGVYAVFPFEHQPTALGSLQFLTDLEMDCPLLFVEKLVAVEQGSKPYALIGWGGWIRGAFAFEEELRTGAAIACRELQERGLDVGMLTGDHMPSGERIARELQISVRAQLNPAEKQQALTEVRKQWGPVVFVGDGVNDAPSLAMADVSISLGSGADVTRDTADVCILSNDLEQVVRLLDLSKRTVRTIRQNLIWAFGYNGIGILLAAAGLLHPAMAAGAMVVSSVFVIGNSLRLSSPDSLEPDALTPIPKTWENTKRSPRGGVTA
ncbi:MAG: cation-translocating P-type ATPase, partial [Planctomycetaceae bacterium]|nr:cation-translocating P-type ATPase [Planctomycetaceae bacterium]